MKLSEVMACVDRVAKNGTNKAQNYSYAMATDIYDAVRAELSRRFVAIVPNVLKSEFQERKTQSGGSMTICTLTVRFDFVDGETGETHTTTLVGSGSDSLDKAPYKAMTGATKNCLINTFLIPTGTDPEHEPKREIPAPQGLDAVKRQMAGGSQRPSPPANVSGVLFPNYGKSKGAPVAGAALQDLEFYANGARRTLADPAKARFHDAERRLLSAIEAEVARQNSSSAPTDNGEPPPISDEYAPPY